jgi:hypothetical protein
MRLSRIAFLLALFVFALPRGAMAQRVDDPEAFIAASMEALQLQTAANARFMGTDEYWWHFSQDSGTITFFTEDGVRATAPLQIVGTYDPDDGTFLWGWDHFSVRKPLRAHARLVRDFGRDNGMPELTECMVEISLERAWELTALAARLGGASGAYRLKLEGGPFVFMTFGTLTLSRP